MIVQIDVTPERVQYIAALVEFWELCDSLGELEDGYAIRLLPRLIRDIAASLENYADFIKDLDDTANRIEWNDKDKHTIRAIYALAVRDDSQESK